MLTHHRLGGTGEGLGGGELLKLKAGSTVLTGGLGQIEIASLQRGIGGKRSQCVYVKPVYTCFDCCKGVFECEGAKMVVYLSENVGWT